MLHGYLKFRRSTLTGNGHEDFQDSAESAIVPDAVSHDDIAARQEKPDQRDTLQGLHSSVPRSCTHTRK